MEHSHCSSAGIRRDDFPDAPRLVATGEIDLAVAAELGRCLATLVDDARSPAFVDLGAVTFMDSSGLDVLVKAHTEAETRGVQLTLLDCTPPVLRVLGLTGLDSLLRLEDRSGG